MPTEKKPEEQCCACGVLGQGRICLECFMGRPFSIQACPRCNVEKLVRLYVQGVCCDGCKAAERAAEKAADAGSFAVESTIEVMPGAGGVRRVVGRMASGRIVEATIGYPEQDAHVGIDFRAEGGTASLLTVQDRRGCAVLVLTDERRLELARLLCDGIGKVVAP